MSDGHEKTTFDPEHCVACRAFANRHKKPEPKPPFVNECWEAAKLKARQLEAEIQGSDASQRHKSNMLHSFSKLWMFATDAWEQEVERPHQRSERAKETK